MSTLSLAIAVALFCAVFSTAAFGYLYYSRREHYLLYWSLCWLMSAFRVGFDLGGSVSGSGEIIRPIGLFFSLSAAMLLLAGAFNFADKRVNSKWSWILGVGAAACLILGLLQISFVWQTLPVFFLLSAATFYAGYVLVRNPKRKPTAEELVSGILLMIWAAHRLNYPFLRTVEWFAPIGYLVASAFQVLVSMTIMFAHFRRSRDELAQSEAHYRNIVETAAEGVCIVSTQGRITFANQRLADMGGYQISDLIGRSMLKFLNQDQRNAALTQGRSFDNSKTAQRQYQLISKSGTPFWVSVAISPLMKANGQPDGWLGMITDISERKAAEDELRRSEEKFRGLFERAGVPITFVDADGRYLLVNQFAARYLGQAQEEIVGKSVFDFFPHDVAQRYQDRTREIIETGKGAEYEDEIQTPGHRPRWFWSIIEPARDLSDRIIGVQIVSHDITERKLVQARLQHEASHDRLTGLPNRSHFQEWLDRCIARASRESEYKFAVLFMDLDHFKTINDSLGHAAGDEFLVEVGKILLRAVRPQDAVARIGGDEFTMLLDGIDSVDDAIGVARRILADLAIKRSVQGHEVEIGVSIGIALSSAGYRRTNDILRDADDAMYRAKSKGRGRYAVFDETMREKAPEERRNESDLRDASSRRIRSDSIRPAAG